MKNISRYTVGRCIRSLAVPSSSLPLSLSRAMLPPCRFATGWIISGPIPSRASNCPIGRGMLPRRAIKRSRGSGRFRRSFFSFPRNYRGDVIAAIPGDLGVPVVRFFRSIPARSIRQSRIADTRAANTTIRVVFAFSLE